MNDLNEVDFVRAVERVASALERIGDALEVSAPKATPKKRAPKKPAPEAEAEAEAPAEEEAPKKTRKKRTPKAKTEVDGISLEDLSALAQDYSKERGKAGADRIRKFLSKLDMKKLVELDADQRNTLAANLRK